MVEELQVVVVDVEVHDHVLGGGEKTSPERSPVVGSGEREIADLGALHRQPAGEVRGGVGGAVLDDDDLEVQSPV